MGLTSMPDFRVDTLLMLSSFDACGDVNSTKKIVKKPSFVKAKESSKFIVKHSLTKVSNEIYFTSILWNSIFAQNILEAFLL
jgi:hypothetical protein